MIGLVVPVAEDVNQEQQCRLVAPPSAVMTSRAERLAIRARCVYPIFLSELRVVTRRYRAKLLVDQTPRRFLELDLSQLLAEISDKSSYHDGDDSEENCSGTDAYTVPTNAKLRVHNNAWRRNHCPRQSCPTGKCRNRVDMQSLRFQRKAMQMQRRATVHAASA